MFLLFTRSDVTADDHHSPFMVFEYMEYGDLAALLQANDPCSGVTPKVKLVEVRVGAFVRRNGTKKRARRWQRRWRCFAAI
jgi:hypothetical protein